MKRSFIVLCCIVALLASGVISYLVTIGCISSGYCAVNLDSPKVSMMEALGLAGTMATILAFVATFAIALMAIDAFAISSAVNRSANNIDRFSSDMNLLEDRLTSASSSISVYELLIKEIDDATEYDDHIFSLFEIVGRSISVDSSFSSLILQCREAASGRRTRINGIRYIASLKNNNGGDGEFSSALPELINQARKGNQRALKIVQTLKDLRVEGIPDDFISGSRTKRSRKT